MTKLDELRKMVKDRRQEAIEMRDKTISELKPVMPGKEDESRLFIEATEKAIAIYNDLAKILDIQP